jgi:hypothetical protein
MPFTLRVRAPVLYASWHGFTGGDLRDVELRLSEMKRTTGRGAVYLSRIPGDERIFTQDECGVLQDFLVAILPSCASIHHVIEGAGFIKSARRATVTNMANATPRPRDFYVHDTLADAFTKIGVLTGVALDDLVSKGVDESDSQRRASGAFRAAARIATEGRTRKG